MNIEDSAELQTWLRANHHLGVYENVDCAILPGGVSNRTVLVKRADGEAWVLKQALPKLRVAVEWLSSPERIEREALGIVCLSRLLPEGSVPRLIFQSKSDYLLAMTAVLAPHENWKAMLLAGRLHLGEVAQFGRLLGSLHRESSVNLKTMPPLLQDRTFFDSLRLDPYYRYTAAQVPASAAFYERLVQDTLASRMTLVHGDYSPKNILVREGRLVLIDHEVIHIGDPGFDVGFALAHLLSKAHHLPQLRAKFAVAAQRFWNEYADSLAGSLPLAMVEERSVRHTLGCLLARVAGKSKLEYMTVDERARQQHAVLKIIPVPAPSISELIITFLADIDSCPS